MDSTKVMAHSIPLARPNITKAEIDAVVAVLQGPTLSLGPKLVEFEEAFASQCSTRFAVGCSSGTAALHLLMQAMGLGPGDEFVTTPFSFVASANCGLMVGATPVFADIDAETWNIDVGKVADAITPRTKLIIPVDVFGQLPDMDPLEELASRHGLRLIEDSCESLGSFYNGKPAGSFGDAGVFGFYPNKQITTGEGGMIVTDDEQLASLCRSLRNQGRDTNGGWLAHPRMGYNYRISELNCAMGVVQLKRLGEIVDARTRIQSWYRQALQNESRIHLQEIHPAVEMSWFVLVVRLADEYTQDDRDRMLRALNERGIGCSNYFAPIHLQPYFVEQYGFKRGDFPNCEAVADRTIALPFHHELTEADVETVCRELRDLL